MNREGHIIIDGFNVIFGDVGLKQVFDRSQEDSKAQLVRYGIELHDNEWDQVTVVFDGKGSQIQIDHPVKCKSFSVIHSPSQLSADGVIERMLSRASQPERMTVVSNDQMIRAAAIGCGADIRSVSWLMNGGGAGGVHHIREARKKTKTGGDARFENRLPL